MQENTELVKDLIPWLIFEIDGNLYTINSKMIISIVIKPDEVTFVPNVPDYIEGLIHLRGSVVPLINLKSLLGKKSTAENNLEVDAKEQEEMVIVLEKANYLVGLVVDEVISVENITAYEKTEEIKNMYNDSFVMGVAKRSKKEDVLLILDEEKIMNNA